MPTELDKVPVVVVGGGSGLGAATAEAFVNAGSRVAVLDLDGATAQAVVAKLPQATAHAADVTDADGLAAAISDASAFHGPPRVGIVTSGVAWAQRVVGKDGPAQLEYFEKVVRVNLVGTYNALRLLGAAMAANEPDEHGERGVIIMTASVAAFDGQIGQTAYAASKGGVAALTLPAARDLARHGVRVVTIAPGLFDTPMLRQLPEEQRKALGEQVPFPQRLGDPEEYGDLAVFIARHRYINGEVIRLDGAIRLAPR
jgi:NAD(P)-dependent dehydrogenase (short-subunit alcohol dehydrogenase family)